jgi:hypothetical protein
MDVLLFLSLAVRFLLLVVGLLVPGAALMRLLRGPVTVATSFAGSAVALYTTVLALQLCGIRISLPTMAGGLGLIGIVATWATSRRSDAVAGAAVRISQAAILQAAHTSKQFGSDVTRWNDRVETPDVGADLSPRNILPGPSSARGRLRDLFVPVTGMGAWTPLYAVFWVAVIWRCVHVPLAGPDIEFRWSFLAEQMLRLGSLDFYPPRSSADFFSYFWVESIPPGAAALHAWAYACAGATREMWTVPAVLLQLWSLHEVLWRSAQRLGGVNAARFTCLAAAACPLLTWSVLLSQETGLTALALAGIGWALIEWQGSHESRWAALAGVFAVVGAAAREYGVVFPLLAAAGLILFRANRWAWLAFMSVVLVSAVWPLRIWVLTGNPFYSLPFAGLFPVNERFVTWIKHDAAALGAPLHSMAGWRDIARYLVLFAPTASVGWLLLAGAATRAHRMAAIALGGVAVMLALWMTSVPYTNGGLFYSLRVTSPALALGALAVGSATAALVTMRPRFAAAAATLMLILVTGGVASSLALASNPWRTPWREWPSFAPQPVLSEQPRDETVSLILQANKSTPPLAHDAPPIVLADSPGYQRRFLPTGVRVIPLWSPQADWLFDRTLSPHDAVQRWRESGVRHLVLTKWKVNLDFFNQHSRWGSPPFDVQLIGETSATAVFSIRAVE